MEKKDYSLQYEDCEGFLRAVLSGRKDSLGTTMAALTAIADACRKRKIRKVLVEHRIPGLLTMTEMFEIGARFPVLFRGVVTAFVIEHPTDPEHPPFAETVAKNRGAAGQLFSSAAEAEAWLKSV